MPRTCSICGSENHGRAMAILDPGSVYGLSALEAPRLCGDCDYGAQVCAACGLIVPSANVAYFPGQTRPYCPVCYDARERCARCGTVDLSRDMRDAWTDCGCAETVRVCLACARGIPSCEYSGDRVIRRTCDECRDIDGDGDSAGEPAPYARRVSAALHYDPDTERRDRDRMYAGVELEVSGPPSAIVRAALARFHAVEVLVKNDSSIDEGAEIVTSPFSSALWNSAVRREMLDCAADLRRAGCKSHGGGQCGIHVHLSLDGLTRVALHGIHRLVYARGPLVCSITRRDFGRWSHEMDSALQTRAAKDKRRTSDRYCAVSIGSELPTCEIRAYRGTLHETTLPAVVEHALSIGPAADAAGLRITDSEHAEYIRAHHYQYPSLYAWLHARPQLVRNLGLRPFAARVKERQAVPCV